ncbi:unnamed protein product [Allacma fusca]|uniref:Uncharacterized protein n=1 Tax=Allacma fusca TaxID=39272 RepID=A0A8J2KZ42_9HEXA|nr:unnamed protein product [Allacma fusca]
MMMDNRKQVIGPSQLVLNGHRQQRERVQQRHQQSDLITILDDEIDNENTLTPAMVMAEEPPRGPNDSNQHIDSDTVSNGSDMKDGSPKFTTVALVFDISEEEFRVATAKLRRIVKHTILISLKRRKRKRRRNLKNW